MKKIIAIMFRLRKDQKLRNGKLPIYLRVKIDGARFEWSTQRYVEDFKFTISGGKVKGATEEAKAINAYLDILMYTPEHSNPPFRFIIAEISVLAGLRVIFISK